MQTHNVGWHFMGQHQCLSESAHPAGRAVTPQIAQPDGAGRAVTGQAPHTPPGAHHAHRLIAQIFGQIQQRRADFGVYRVDAFIGGMAQRDNQDIQAAPLECRDFLRDKGLGQARITLEHKCDPARLWRTQRLSQYAPPRVPVPLQRS